MPPTPCTTTTALPAATPAVAQFYQRLFGAGCFVFDEDEPYFQERLLQVIWNEQYLQAPLRTTAGAALGVIHPGIWNVGAGPDFHSAVVTVDGQVRRGAVEVHRRPADWQRHGHDRDPAYAGVVLHVVWDAPPEGGPPLGVPLLALAGQLARPLREIIAAVDLTAYPYARQVQPGAPAAQLAALSDEQVRELFQSYGVARVLDKALRLGAEVAQLGLEEAVYRRFLDALGYKNNRAACAALAELLPLDALSGATPADCQALLLGAAGLLPDPSQAPVRPEYRDWLAELWRRWWPRRREYRDLGWRRQGQRPANSPERRLLAAALVLPRCEYRLGAALLAAFDQETDPAAVIRRLAAVCHADDPRYREFHSFTSALHPPAALLGASRIRDLLVNLAVPLYFADCFRRQQPERCAHGRAVLARLPQLEANRRLTEAVHRLFVPPSRGLRLLNNACAQQGLLLLADEERAHPTPAAATALPA